MSIARVIRRNQKPCQFYRVGRSDLDQNTGKRARSISEAIDGKATLQPATSTTLKTFAEGDKFTAAWVIWTLDKVFAGDLVDWKGEAYKVIEVHERYEGNFHRALIDKKGNFGSLISASEIGTILVVDEW